jgi:hypothetical protein
MKRWQEYYEDTFQEDAVNTEENENNENPPHGEGRQEMCFTSVKCLTNF